MRSLVEYSNGWYVCVCVSMYMCVVHKCTFTGICTYEHTCIHTFTYIHIDRICVVYKHTFRMYMRNIYKWRYNEFYATEILHFSRHFVISNKWQLKPNICYWQIWPVIYLILKHANYIDCICATLKLESYRAVNACSG